MSSSTSTGGGGGGGRRGGGGDRRQRWNNEVWPEPFLESLACEVGINASRAHGRLAAAPAISNLFQVCSSWQSISHSDHLWQTLSGRVWGRYELQHNTWRDEYVVRHRRALNFHSGNAVYASLGFNLGEDDGEVEVENLTCRRLALSDFHLACGLVDGSVRVFDLRTRLHVSTFRPHERDRLGRFSGAVSGIGIPDDDDIHFKVVFASLDGDVHVAMNGNGGTRRVQLGNVVNDGTLVDFSGGSRRWWVGLYAGVPGRSFHVWNASTEELVYVGGSLTDPESVMGWHLLSEDSNESIGRVRICGEQSALASTSLGLVSIDLTNGLLFTSSITQQHRHLGEGERGGVIVDTVDVTNNPTDGVGLVAMVDNRGVGRIRRVSDYQEVCRFRLQRGRRRRRGRVLGCINGGCVLLWSGDVIRAWEVERGEYLYQLTVPEEEHIGEATAMATNETYLALSTIDDTTIHLWDFGAV